MITKVQKNNPSRAGERASGAEMFGPWGRYRIEARHTRFEAVEWHVTDAEAIDQETGLPSVIRQAATQEEARKGLLGEKPVVLLKFSDLKVDDKFRMIEDAANALLRKTGEYRYVVISATDSYAIGLSCEMRDIDEQVRVV